MSNKCYKCKYRRTIPGDAHSRCAHPATGKQKAGMGGVFDAIVSMVDGRASEAAKKLNIEADPHGVRSGWFMWPANFDPVWLRNCDGFEAQEEED